jgi:hypothetical protein
MLNIGATGSLKPYVKFNAKADKWFAKGEAGDAEIGRPTFLADLAGLAALPRGPSPGAGDRPVSGPGGPVSG